jgi:hypothetical protein
MWHSVIWVGQKVVIFQIGKTTLSNSYTLLFERGISVKEPNTGDEPFYEGTFQASNEILLGRGSISIGQKW